MNPKPASPRYRRRNRWPMLVVLAVLLIGGAVVWSQVLKPAPPLATGCNQPGPPPSASLGASQTTGSASQTTGSANQTTGTTSTAGSSAASTQVRTSLGTFIDPNQLAATRPADPSEVPLRVLNASTVVGQAKSVTDELRDAGFSSILKQGNDPLYPASDLQCYGEIRYGNAGLAEARTVLIVAPCAQLVLDGRTDNSVDLSLGKLYQIAPISKRIQNELTQVKDASAPPPVIEGQTVSVRPVPTIPPLPSRAGCPS